MLAIIPSIPYMSRFRFTVIFAKSWGFPTDKGINLNNPKMAQKGDTTSVPFNIIVTNLLNFRQNLLTD